MKKEANFNEYILIIDLIIYIFLNRNFLLTLFKYF